MYIDAARLEKWIELARRDDCFTAAAGFIPSDIREMLGEIRRLRDGVTALAANTCLALEQRQTPLLCVAISRERKLNAERPDMTEDQIKHMVDRFLRWRLPENFNPDGGIKFVRPDYPPAVAAPFGTNLFDAVQADAMVRYMIEGMPR